MRIALAAIFHLTNSFSRRSTTLNEFNVETNEQDGSRPCDPYGVGLLTEALHTAAEESGHVITPVLSAIGRSGGPITGGASEQLCRRLQDELNDRLDDPDALILVLSGAAFDERGHSFDLSVIQSARQSIPADAPIVGLFSPEAILTQEILDAIDLPLVLHQHGAELESIVGNAIRLLPHLADLTSPPTSELRRTPVLLSVAARARGSETMRDLRALAAEFESEPGVIAASIIPGFPFADVGPAGMQALVSTANDRGQAARLAERLKSAAWDRREEFETTPVNIEIAVHDAMLSNTTPVVIFDAGDDPMLGGAADGTGMLWALIDLGAPEVALGVIVDPSGVEQSITAGIGTSLSLDVGGSFDRRSGYPVNVTSTVKHISADDPRYANGCPAGVGRAAVLDVEGRHGGQIELILTERAPLSVEPALFDALGIDLSAKRIVGVKSSGLNRAAYESIASRILETTTPGITTPSLRYLDYQRVPRPIFPLDDAR